MPPAPGIRADRRETLEQGWMPLSHRADQGITPVYESQDKTQQLLLAGDLGQPGQLEIEINTNELAIMFRELGLSEEYLLTCVGPNVTVTPANIKTFPVAIGNFDISEMAGLLRYVMAVKQLSKNASEQDIEKRTMSGLCLSSLSTTKTSPIAICIENMQQHMTTWKKTSDNSTGDLKLALGKLADPTNKDPELEKLRKEQIALQTLGLIVHEHGHNCDPLKVQLFIEKVFGKKSITTQVLLNKSVLKFLQNSVFSGPTGLAVLSKCLRTPLTRDTDEEKKFPNQKQFLLNDIITKDRSRLSNIIRVK